jgi:hypothetical protein
MEAIQSMKNESSSSMCSSINSGFGEHSAGQIINDGVSNWEGSNPSGNIVVNKWLCAACPVCSPVFHFPMPFHPAQE